jgi:predicted dehydrogenase
MGQRLDGFCFLGAGYEAVLIATPDHWHAPAGIMACDAGKHAYVEKPCSHNIREGRLLLDAARRSHVVVQHGTQSRSSQFIADGIQMLREGIIGDVLVAKAWNDVQNPSDTTPSRSSFNHNHGWAVPFLFSSLHGQ